MPGGRLLVMLMMVTHCECGHVQSDKAITTEGEGKGMSDREPLARGPEIPRMRRFDSGATRNTDVTKLDYEGFLSPLVLRKFAEYMHEHRRQADGTLRSADNWQRGIPEDVYMSSMWRHFMDVWMTHRGYEVNSPEDDHVVGQQEALCALLFNVSGMLHETLKEK